MPEPTRNPSAARKLIGERLISRGLLTEPQLEMGLQEQKRTGVLLGRSFLALVM